MTSLAVGEGIRTAANTSTNFLYQLCSGRGKKGLCCYPPCLVYMELLCWLLGKVMKGSAQYPLVIPYASWHSKDGMHVQVLPLKFSDLHLYNSVMVVVMEQKLPFTVSGLMRELELMFREMDDRLENWKC